MENNEKYTGEYEDGQPHGQGTLTYSDGTMYIGEWKSGDFHGQGTLTYPDGLTYVGGWKDGQRNGQGTVTHACGDKNKFIKRLIQYGTLVDYVGEWRDGEKYGRGTGVSSISMKRTTETGDFVSDIERYVGEFLNGLPHGDGIYHYANGDKYISTWWDGEVFGQGNFVPNGAEEVVTAGETEEVLAAEQGDAYAQFNLALMYDNGQGVPQDDKEAAKWYRLAAEQGLGDAQYNLSLCYYEGQGVEKDLEKANYWHNKSTEQDNATTSNIVKYFEDQKNVLNFEYWKKKPIKNI